VTTDQKPASCPDCGGETTIEETETPDGLSFDFHTTAHESGCPLMLGTTRR
jgi:hypothetical protein